MTGYESIHRQIRSHYNEYTGDANVYSVTSLLLIDYQPVIRWVDGLAYYAYVTVSDSKLTIIYKHKDNARVFKDLNKIPRQLLGQPLKDFLEGYEGFYHLKEWATLENVKYEDSELQQNSVRFQDCQKELDAIMILTSEFEWIEKIVADPTYNQEHTLFGIEFPPTVASKNLGSLQFMQWLRRMYLDYMTDVNLRLLDYYYQNSRRIRSYDESSVIFWFTELVPCLVQFRGIYNPLLDGKVMEMLRREFPKWQAEMLTLNNIPALHGGRGYYNRDSNPVAFYTTRASVEKITLQTASNVFRGKHMEFYSPKFFMAEVCSAVWGRLSDIQAPAIFYRCNIPLYCLVENDRIIDITYKKIQPTAKMQVLECTYVQAAFIEMLTGVYGFNSYSTIQRGLRTLADPSIERIKSASVIS